MLDALFGNYNNYPDTVLLRMILLLLLVQAALLFGIGRALLRRK